MSTELDTWYAYECFNPTCQSSGTVFDVRLSGACRLPLPQLRCPVCAAPCTCRATWDSDEFGFKEAPRSPSSIRSSASAKSATTSSKQSVKQLLYWYDVPGSRPQDFVLTSVTAEARHTLVRALQSGREGEAFKGIAKCRICGAALGNADIHGWGFVWPQKAEHYILFHSIWTPECDQLLAHVRHLDQS